LRLYKGTHICIPYNIEAGASGDIRSQARAWERDKEDLFMLLKLIACEVFTREICDYVAKSPHIIDIEFTEKGSHDKSDFLRESIQSKIDASQNGIRKYDAILLCYGLCGNGTVNLLSRNNQLVIPRAHDCCTIFLGSKKKFKKYFSDNPSLSFSSAGYLERGDSYVHNASISKFLGLDKTYEDYVNLYGKENAEFIIQTLNPALIKEKDNKVIYIETRETRYLGYAEKCKEKAQAENKEFILLKGSSRLIKNLVLGNWNAKEFLIVKPNQNTVGIYDHNKIIYAEDVK
jgi:hypothetical protein